MIPAFISTSLISYRNIYHIFCRRILKDLTPEENNFLVVFYTLKKIVHPVIKNQLHNKCSDGKLLLILNEIYQKGHYEGTNEGTQRRRQKLYFKRSQIFSPTSE